MLIQQHLIIPQSSLIARVKTQKPDASASGPRVGGGRTAAFARRMGGAPARQRRKEVDAPKTQKARPMRKAGAALYAALLKIQNRSCGPAAHESGAVPSTSRTDYQPLPPCRRASDAMSYRFARSSIIPLYIYILYAKVRFKSRNICKISTNYTQMLNLFKSLG